MRVLLLLVFSPLFSVDPADAWTIGGRLGAELDGLGENQRSYSVFDPVELESPAITRTTTTRALMELRLEGAASNHLSLRLVDTARLASARSRNSLLGETAWILPSDRLRLEGRWDVQGGRDEPASGSNEMVTATWDRSSLPAALKSRVRVGADWSQTANPDLAGIFDYRILKGDFQLSRDLGERVDLRALAGYRHKDADGPRGYDQGIGEIEANCAARSRDRFDAILRIEDRAYRADSVEIPSFVIATLSARYDLRASDALRPYLDQTVEAQNYRGQSGIFQDHRSWKAEAGTDVFLNRLRRHESVADSASLLAADWRLRIGASAEIFRVASSVDADSASFLPAFDSFGGVARIAREGGESFWFDFGIEAGRRMYRDHAETLHLVYEGLNLSLASSDYTYVSASLLVQWNPFRWLLADAFVQWDGEMHDQSQDDFRLWIANVSLTYPF